VTVAEARILLESPEFRQLVVRRWRVSLALAACLFAAYYGYILIVALQPALLTRRVGEATTLGLPLAAAVIAAAWLLTVAYAWWAGARHDGDVARLRDRLRR
jgi:uncharacterized membrane protein (DUF485 family)